VRSCNHQVLGDNCVYNDVSNNDPLFIVMFDNGEKGDVMIVFLYNLVFFVYIYR
jgi:hypothetical protein